MSQQVLEEVAEMLLGRAAAAGATAADVVVAEADSLAVGVRLGEVEKVKRARAKHLGLRVFVRDRCAITSTADFSPDSLSRLATDTVSLARVTSPDPFAGLAAADELAQAVPDLALYDPSIADLNPQEAIDWCRTAETAALEADARITNSGGAQFEGGSRFVFYATSNGFRGSYRSSEASLWVVPVATENGSMQRDYWYTTKRHLAELEPPAEVGRTAAERAVRRLGARKVGTGQVPVVFDPETAASLLGHLAGAVSGNALYKGASFLIDMLGEQIAPPFVQVYDEGTRPGALGSKPFDAEGVPTRRTTVVEGGVLLSYLFDCYSARKLNSKTTGNATRAIPDAPYVGTTNFVLQPGPDAPEDIIASVRSGLYVTELLGFGVNPVTGDYSRGATGLWIENGRLAYPVEEITIAGNLLDMFRNIEAVGNDLVLRQSTASPTLKIGRLTVAGS